MTNDKRLEHQTPSHKRGSTHSPGHDYKAAEIRAEELQAVSPVFRKLLRKKQTNPSSDQWRRFSQELQRKLEIQDAPYTQALRDRISATDSVLLRWLWVVLALLALLAIGTGIGISLIDQPAPTATVTKRHQHILIAQGGTDTPVGQSAFEFKRTI